MNVVDEITREPVRDDLPQFSVGDRITVNVRIVEGGTERVQPFTGTVIARSGEGVNENITVRRISYGQGVERVLPLHSPVIRDIKVVRRGKSRQSKMFYVREKPGKL